MRLLYTVLFLLLISLASQGQEQLLDLQYNPVIKDRLSGYSQQSFLEWFRDTTPVALPFYDDFSSKEIYPSPLKWSDQYGFENSDWPVNPINLGVLTLDAIDDTGALYPDAVPGPVTFIADHLTSRYIRLDSAFTPVPHSLSPADSVYLSFWYQPQGIGSAPKPGDSLVLQFLAEPAHDSISPTDTTRIPDRWVHIWATNGMTLDTFYLKYNSYFRQIIIPITDTVFFKPTFQFQFYNYASLASNSEPSWQSNCCQWNLDNIYLNTNRTRKDTIYREIRFIHDPPSMLRQYQAMPYSQYCDNPTEEMTDTIPVTFRNWDTIAHTVAYKYQVSTTGGNIIKTWEPDENLLVRPSYEYNDLTVYPPVQFLYPISTSDSAAFEVRHFVNDVTPGSDLGDTISMLQKFYNYYAYDDGTPEKGYGLTKAGSRMAYRFNLNKSPDTLRGVGIFFNRTLSGDNQQFFYLVVWNDNNGKPGDTVYSELVYVRFSESLYKFETYRFNKPVRVSGSFYVGTITTTDDNLNIGFDRYLNSQNNLFYNSTGQWFTSAYSGSLLFRPLLGKPIPLGVEDPQAGSGGKLTIYPNPCTSGLITIRCEIPGMDDPLNGTSEIRVRNLFGQELISGKFTGTVDVSGLAPGLYIIEFTKPASGLHITGKLLIAGQVAN